MKTEVGFIFEKVESMLKKSPVSAVFGRTPTTKSA